MERSAVAASAVVAMLLSGCNQAGPEHDNSTSAAPDAVCPQLMESVECEGGDLEGGVIFVDDLPGCCERCQGTLYCDAFTFHPSTNLCELKRGCQHLVPPGLYSQRPLTATLPGRLAVQRGLASLPGMSCSEQAEIAMFYPDWRGSFPVAVYSHPSLGRDMGGLDGLDAFFEEVAALGFIVMAPFGMNSNISACNGSAAGNITSAVELAMQKGVELHSSLSQADWRRIAVLGHSYGAGFAPETAAALQSSGLNLTVAAMVVSHAPGFCKPEKVTAVAEDIPAMFTTGTSDTADSDDHVLDYFQKYSSSSKVYAKLSGASSNEPVGEGRLNSFTASFLACHVQDKAEECQLVYSDTPQALCQAHQFETCIVIAKDNATAPHSESVFV